MALAVESVHVVNDTTKKRMAVESQTVRRPAPITTDIFRLLMRRLSVVVVVVVVVVVDYDNNKWLAARDDLDRDWLTSSRTEHAHTSHVTISQVWHTTIAQVERRRHLSQIDSVTILLSKQLIIDRTLRDFQTRSEHVVPIEPMAKNKKR